MHKNRRAPGSRPVLCIYLYSGGTSPDSLPVSYGYRAVLSGLRRKPDVPVPSPSGFCICLSENAAIFLLLPPGLFMAVWMAVRYVRTGSTRLTRVQACVFYVMIGVLLVFGVLRNLPGFGWLRP